MRERFGLSAFRQGQREVIAWLQPGQSMREIAEHMQVIQKEKLPDLHVHGFGHCLGLGIHDRPFITVDDNRLTEPGMVMQIEHITTDGHETYHVEDSVVFHDGGVELLSTYSDTTRMFVIE